MADTLTPAELRKLTNATRAAARALLDHDDSRTTQTHYPVVTLKKTVR